MHKDIACETSILEVGCARSIWLPYFAREFSFKITGLDYTGNGCSQTEDILRQSKRSILKIRHNALKLLGEFLRPGGILISFITNKTGAIGFFQKFFDHDNYKIHIPLNRRVFEVAHKKAGFIVESCDYFFAVNWTAINLEKLKLVRIRSWLSKVFWILEEKAGLRLKPNQLTSPFILGVSKKPCD